MSRRVTVITIMVFGEEVGRVVVVHPLGVVELRRMRVICQRILAEIRPADLQLACRDGHPREQEDPERRQCVAGHSEQCSTRFD